MSPSLLLLSVALSASVLELDELLRSIERFPSIIAASEERRAAGGETMAARGAFDPVLKSRAIFDVVGYYKNQVFDVSIEAPTPLWGTTLIAGYRAGLGDFPVYDGKLATNSAGEVRAAVQIPLLRNGPIDRRRANIQRAELGEKIAGEGLRLSRLELERAAVVRYWEWVAAGYRLRVAEQLLALAEARQGQVQARVKAGDIPDIERVENERALRQREAQIVAAQRALEQTAIELSVFLRDERGESMQPDRGRLPLRLNEPSKHATNLAEAVADSWQLRPERRRLQLMDRQNQIELRLAKNQLLPGLDVFGLVSQDLGGGEKVRAKPEFELGVTLDLALLFRNARGRVQAADAMAARTRAQLQLIDRRLEAEVRDVLSALSAGHQRLALVRKELELARALAKAELERFELGDSTLLMVNLREQAAAEAAVREVDLLAELQRTEAQLRLTRGRTLAD